MNDYQWHDFGKAQPPLTGHIVTGKRRPDGSWQITGIHPPGSARDAKSAGGFWACLPEWIIEGPPKR